MSVSGRKFTHVSPADDLAAESDGSLRHGFVNGAVYAMALSSANRKVISGNLYARLPGHVAGSCQVFNSEMKRQTKTDADERAYDSDVFVSCDSSDWEGHSRKTAVPIIEVMQPSTERTDRTAKFEAYRHNPSLIECVLLSKVAIELDLSRLRTGGQREFFQRDNADTLESLDLTLNVSSLYRRVTIDGTPAVQANTTSH